MDNKIYEDPEKLYEKKWSVEEELEAGCHDHTGFIHNGRVGSRPFNFEKLAQVAKDEFNFDMSKPEKIVMVGDQLTSDILFGNLNGMATVWVHRFRDFFTKDEFKVDGFKEGMEEPITKDGINEVY